VNVRAITEDDLPAIAAFLADDEERLLGRPSRIGIEDVRSWIDPASFATRSWLYEEPAGSIAALGWAEVHGEVGVAVGVVSRDAIGRGLGSELIERSETVLREEGVARIHQIALAADVPAAELLAARGYRQVRRFWEMTIELGDEPPAAPSLPGGMRIETFEEHDARPFHDALEEAFQDHWEHHARPFEEWWNEKRSAPDYTPALWFLVRDGDEIAAVTRNDPNRNGGGWIGALGVRRRWRGRGLARALLLHSFREFHLRGQRRVGLGVDAENPTGATRLYESVGMHVELEQVVCEKVVA
jgi:mycothiol synthase